MSPPAGFEFESPLFHVTHLSDDMDQARTVYQRLFRRPILDAGFWELGGRWAFFVYLGDVWVEAAYADERPSGLRSFLNRFGSRLHSLAWYVKGIDDLANTLRDAKSRFAEDPDPAVAYRSFSVENNVARRVPRHGPIPLPPGYRHTFDPDWRSAVVYTHFRDTHGMLEFCEPTSYHVMPPRVPDEDMIVLPDQDPLGLVRSSHHTIVVHDVAAARSFWLDTMGATLLAHGHNEPLGTDSAWVRVGNDSGTVLELAQPIEDGPARSDLDTCGLPILHTVNFVVNDLARAREHIQSVGMTVETGTASLIVTDPSTTAGARFGFTSSSEPWLA
ncbi:MAG: VOC family protein [Ilumatobacteraceae bacterium]